MSASDTDIVMTLSIGGRRFQVLIMRDTPTTWFGAISERPGSQGRTQPLGSVETQAGPDAALQAALDYILQTVGFTPRATPATAAAWSEALAAAGAGGPGPSDANTDQAPAGGEPPLKTIRQWREEQGWSQLDLAGFLGVSQGLISRWERGVAIPPEPHQYRLARLFGVSVTAIAFGHDVGHTETIDNEREAHAEVGMEDA